MCVITDRKLLMFLSKNVWFFEISDDDDDGVDAFLSTLTLSPMYDNWMNINYGG
jgi:hypothetical protein